MCPTGHDTPVWAAPGLGRSILCPLWPVLPLRIVHLLLLGPAHLRCLLPTQVGWHNNGFGILPPLCRCESIISGTDDSVNGKASEADPFPRYGVVY